MNRSAKIGEKLVIPARLCRAHWRCFAAGAAVFGFVAGLFSIYGASTNHAQVAPAVAAMNSSHELIQLQHSTQARLAGAYGKLPLTFEPNFGQFAEQVQFLSRGQGYSLSLTREEAVLAFNNSSVVSGQSAVVPTLNTVKGRAQRTSERKGERKGLTAGTLLRMKLLNANPAARVMGLDELAGKSNYFLGQDPTRWRTNVPNYARVKYENVYPGVDLIYHSNPGQVGQLEYDFVVAPGVDPGTIRLALTADEQVSGGRKAVASEDGNWKTKTGNSKLKAGPSKIQYPMSKIDLNGDLVFQIDMGEIRLHKPVVYQLEEGRQSSVVSSQLNGTAGDGQRTPDNRQSSIDNRKFVDGRFVIRPHHQIGFEVASYDHAKPLLIDPVLSYSTYLGGSGADVGYGIAVDSNGNAYITGSASSTNFPTVTPLQSAKGGGTDVFVSKLSADGTKLVYSTYLGGGGSDRGNDIAIDSAGNAYVTGFSASSNFPTTTGAFQIASKGNGDAFVVKLNATGSALVYSTYLGGGDADFGQGIAVDSSGSAYVTGSTQSVDFPTAAPLQAANGGAGDAFVTKLSADGTKLVYSTYLGGGGADTAQGIAVDSSGDAFVAGFTASNNFPVTTGSLQTISGGSGDAFVAEVNAAGSALVYSTYLGGSGLDRISAIALDSSGRAFVTGATSSNDFPTTAGSFQTSTGGNGDAFVTVLNVAGSAAVYSTYVGGNDIDQGSGIAVDAAGDAYVIGFTRSNNFPTLNPVQAVIGGGTCGSGACSDVFAIELNSSGAGLVYSTYLGGSGDDVGQGIALDSAANAYLTGSTASPNFPAIAGSLQTAAGAPSVENAFVAKIAPLAAPALSLSPTLLTFPDEATNFASAPLTVTLTNFGSAPLAISSITVSGDFAETDNCAGSIAAGGANCVVTVTFTPTVIGVRTGTITITDNGAGSPHMISLSGNGVAPAPKVVFSPTSLTFPDQVIGSTSTPLTATMTNTGTADLTITSIVAGTDYAQTNNCGTTVAAGTSCAIAVTFTPTATGSRAAAITVTDNATGSPQSVALSGQGLAQFSLASNVATATVAAGVDTTTFTITAVAPSTFIDSITLACGGSLPAGSCSFSPTSIKAGETSTLTVSGLKVVTTSKLSFTVTGTDGAQTFSLPLSILLGNYSLSVAPPLVNISAGDTAGYTVTLTPINGFNGTIALTCGFLPVPPNATTCAYTPASITLDGSTASTVTLTVSTVKRSLLPPPANPRFPLTQFLGLLTFVMISCSLVLSRKRKTLIYAAPLAMLVLLAILSSSCNNYYFNPFLPAPDKGTPPGVYTVSIIAKSGSLTQITTVNLGVN